MTETAQPYDSWGARYSTTRHSDPSIARRVVQALGDARTVLNVGAGTGSYEPTDRWLVAVEPSAVMLAQRAVGAAPAIRAVAERLPFRTRAFDAAMAIFTIHHWSDVRQGLVEMRRVAKQRLIILTWEQAVDLIAILWAPLTCYQFRFRTIVQTVLISRFGDAPTPISIPTCWRLCPTSPPWRKSSACLVCNDSRGIWRMAPGTRASATFSSLRKSIWASDL